MASMRITRTRAQSQTTLDALTHDFGAGSEALSTYPAVVTAILDAIYGPNPVFRDKDSRVYFDWVASKIGAANTRAYFGSLSVDYS
jgi:hypothetical protein